MKRTLTTREERLLLSLERRFDLIQREARKALGEIRELGGYHMRHKQLKITGYIEPPEWKLHHKDNRQRG